MQWILMALPFTSLLCLSKEEATGTGHRNFQEIVVPLFWTSEAIQLGGLPEASAMDLVCGLCDLEYKNCFEFPDHWLNTFNTLCFCRPQFCEILHGWQSKNHRSRYAN